jgi:hypothetical protein
MGKYARKTFPSSEHRSKGILDLIHSDVCGPMSVQSVSGFKYYVIFIDDYSRKTWIYFLKTKDEVFDRFREFRALVENQTGRRIRVLRSTMGVSTPPRVCGLLCSRGDQEGAHSSLQSSTEWSGREKEQDHSRSSTCDDT